MENKISIHDTNVSVWEEKVDEQAFRKRTFEPVIRFLTRRGFKITADPRVLKHYRRLSGNHRIGVKGELHCGIELSGRCFKVEFWQEKYNRENRNGGRYEFDKRQKMPFLLGLRCDLEMSKLTAFLHGRLGYPVENSDHKGETADQFIARRYAESWHTDKTLGRPVCNYDGNRKSADGGLIEHGQTVWFYTRRGRLQRGQVFYNINNMHWVKLNRMEVTNLASFELYTTRPENPRLKKNDRHRRKRLEEEIALAVTRMNFSRAQVLKDILFGSQPLFRIWAKDKSAWYRSNYAGYTESLTHAGLYREEEARAEVQRVPHELVMHPVAKGAR